MLVVVTDLGGVNAGAILALELARGAAVGGAVIRLVRFVTAVILERKKSMVKLHKNSAHLCHTG